MGPWGRRRWADNLNAPPVKAFPIGLVVPLVNLAAERLVRIPFLRSGPPTTTRGSQLEVTKATEHSRLDNAPPGGTECLYGGTWRGGYAAR